MRILVLGSTGMVGASVTKQLRQAKNVKVETASRGSDRPEVLFQHLNDLYEHIGSSKYDYVVNCIGLVRNSNLAETKDFERINGIFPQEFAKCLNFHQPNSRLIHVGSDGVFSANVQPKKEETKPNSGDIYGKSKAEGDFLPENSLVIRAAITGESNGNSHSLVNRIKNNMDLESLILYPNHTWNGISVNSFSRAIVGIILNSVSTSGIRHLIPSDIINKQQLVEILFNIYGKRLDQYLNSVDLSEKHLELETSFPNWVSDIWKMSGYIKTPSVFESLSELKLNEA